MPWTSDSPCFQHRFNYALHFVPCFGYDQNFSSSRLCGCELCVKVYNVRKNRIKRQIATLVADDINHNEFESLDDFLWTCRRAPWWLYHLSQQANNFTIICDGTSTIFYKSVANFSFQR